MALVFLKIYFLEKMRVQEATWVDLGSPKGVKMRAAEGQKRSYVEMILSSAVEVKLR